MNQGYVEILLNNVRDVPECDARDDHPWSCRWLNKNFSGNILRSAFLSQYVGQFHHGFVVLVRASRGLVGRWRYRYVNAVVQSKGCDLWNGIPSRWHQSRLLCWKADFEIPGWEYQPPSKIFNPAVIGNDGFGTIKGGSPGETHGLRCLVSSYYG